MRRRSNIGGWRWRSRIRTRLGWLYQLADEAERGTLVTTKRSCERYDSDTQATTLPWKNGPGILEFDRFAMEEKRKQPRTDVDEPGYILIGGSPMSCRVLNISIEGAALEVRDPALVPNNFQLTTTKDHVTRNCRTVWIAQNRIGVIFIGPNRDPTKLKG